MKKYIFILPIIGLMFLSACAGHEDVVMDEDKSAETLYNEAYDYLEMSQFMFPIIILTMLVKNDFALMLTIDKLPLFRILRLSIVL